MNPEEISRQYKIGKILIQRWAATWIDLIIVIVMFWGIMLLLDFIAGEMFDKLFYLFLSTVIAACFAYYIILEGLYGITIGKLVLKLHVVTDQFENPGIGKAIIRTIFRIIEVNPIFIGGLPAGIIVLINNKKKQRLGDIFSKTYVIRECDRKNVSEIEKDI